MSNDIEREAFEDALEGEAHFWWIPEAGQYNSTITQKMWQTWQRARAQQGEAEPVATTLASDPFDENAAPNEVSFSLKDWKRLGALPAGTELFVKSPTGFAGGVPEQAPGSGWIRCSEEMPKRGQRVRLFSQGVIQHYMPVLDEGDEGPFWSFDGICDYDPPVDFKRDQWKPMDQPPAEDEA